MEEKMNVFEKAKRKFKLDDMDKEAIEEAIVTAVIAAGSCAIGIVIGRYQGREEVFSCLIEALANSKKDN